MRRRRQKNPLLMRIILISILAHIIILPILAHFGAFKKIQRQFVEVTAVRLPPPPAQPERKEEAKKPQKPKPEHMAQKARKGNTTTSHQRQAPIRAAANIPHIATAAGSGGGGFEAQQGTGKMGQVAAPINTAPTQPTVKAEPPTQPKPPAPEPKPTEKPKEIASAKPVEPAPQPKPEPAPTPKQPVFTEAQPAVPLADEPQPVIPDDLRDEALDKTCVAEVTVGPDGKPTDVKVYQSSGNDELDRLALEAARQWKFKPGTRDGQPVESVVRLHIEFQVS